MFSPMIFNDMSQIVNLAWKSVGALALLGGLATPAGAAIGDWVWEGNARVRLVASGVDAEGRLAAGLEIDLDPGWKTYWRSPGDAGIPPAPDFPASINTAGPVAIGFPPPHRYDYGYAVSNVYEGRVLLTLSAKVTDPSSPVRLAVGLDMGVCAEVCIPERFDVAVDIAPGESDAEADALLADARAALPGKPELGAFDVEYIVRAGGDDKRPV